MVGDGVRDSGQILAMLGEMIATRPDARIDYVTIRHQATLQEQPQVDGDSVLLLAVSIGKTRLIDNALLFG
jgi:pantoate--beta-alanine ligase